MDLETRIEILERRFADKRAEHFVEGVVPRLRDEKQPDESWREFKNRLELSPGWVKLKRWCSTGEMPDWMVDTVEAELDGEDKPPIPRVPREISPTTIAAEKQRIREAYSD